MLDGIRQNQDIDDTQKGQLKVSRQSLELIIIAHMDNILKLNPCSNDKPHQMRYIFDQILVQIRGLESLGVKLEKSKPRVNG